MPVEYMEITRADSDAKIEDDQLVTFVYRPPITSEEKQQFIDAKIPQNHRKILMGKFILSREMNFEHVVHAACKGHVKSEEGNKN